MRTRNGCRSRSPAAQAGHDSEQRQRPRPPLRSPVPVLSQLLQVKGPVAAGGCGGLAQAEVDQVVLQVRAEQGIRREIADGPDVCCILSVGLVKPRGIDPSCAQLDRGTACQGSVVIVLGGQRGRLRQAGEEMVAQSRPGCGPVRRRSVYPQWRVRWYYANQA